MEFLIILALTVLIYFHFKQNFQIMANQAELKAQVDALTIKAEKIGTETRTLVTKVEGLLKQLEEQQAVTPELQASVDALQTQLEVVDGLVPDATEPTPGEGDETTTL